MSRIGITPDTTVVFYGDKNNWWASYAFWVFQLFGHTNAKVMDGGRLKWEKEGRPTDARRAAYPATAYARAGARRRADPRLPRRGAGARQTRRPLVDVRSPEEYSGERLHMPDYPQRRRAARRPHPRREERPVGARDQPGRRHVQDRRANCARLYVEEQGLEPAERRHRLLPHRRAQQPHLVRADLPARASRTSATTTAAGPSGATWSACRSRSSLETTEHDDRCRAPESARHVRDLRATDPADRADLLLDYADQFREVPPRWRRARSRRHQVPQCESDAYVWAVPRPTGPLKLHFAVENPSGVSAKALAAILDATLSGPPAGGDRPGHPRDRRADLPPEHLDGQGHGPDVDGAGRAGAGQGRAAALTVSPGIRTAGAAVGRTAGTRRHGR